MIGSTTCISPVDDAATTRKHLRNNYGRAGGREKRPTEPGKGRSAVSKRGDGAVMRRRLPRKKLAKWKKQVDGEDATWLRFCYRPFG